MGYQDRDYYRERWAKKERYVEKSPLRMNLGQAAKKRSHCQKTVLIFLLAFFGFAVVFFLFK